MMTAGYMVSQEQSKCKSEKWGIASSDIDSLLT